ncbi:hypothetical protein P167DRAFT_532838 [Morchella conica CCBAS932]|uniref:Uncharacterized protein n=1 Tax=Morchella conica CCBAS932 TaxID=1392247 RepID=A0A3N4L347_9PEZI|nr:hypothetical protein P167DRAFT_532838 [Morchella conica CCBAS932]
MQCSTAILMWLLLLLFFYSLMYLTTYMIHLRSLVAALVNIYYVNSPYVPSHPNNNTTLSFSRVACTC